MTTCKVFRSDKKAETYLYLGDEMDFKDLPQELQDRFGKPFLVMSLELTEGRKLARVDVGSVLESLAECGFYLQLPPKLPIEDEIASRLS